MKFGGEYKANSFLLQGDELRKLPARLQIALPPAPTLPRQPRIKVTRKTKMKRKARVKRESKSEAHDAPWSVRKT